MSSSGSAPRGVALGWAEEAHALVQVRPRDALELAERALKAAAREDDTTAKVAALHALGWAQFALGDSHAIATLRAGVRIGVRNGDTRRVALIRRLLAVLLSFAGQTRAARREIDESIALLHGPDRARSQVHRLEIHRRSHSTDPETHRRVCADAARALRILRREGDEMWEARLLYNRGLLLADRGEFDQAEADLAGAHTLCVRLGADAAALDVVVALGELALLRGDVLSCLSTFDRAQGALPSGQAQYGLAGSRATALAQARLLPEARAAAESYVALCTRTGVVDEVPKAMLDLAAIAIMSGDAAAARRFAAGASRSYAARGKPVNAAMARAVALRARLLDGSLRRSSLRSGLDAAAALETAGWHREALRTRLLAARVALAVGSRRTARRQLELAGPLRRSGTVSDRIELCHVRALLLLSEGDPSGADRLLRAGLRLLEDYRGALGAVELRAAASGIGIELSRRGLQLALETGDPAQILAWAERLRGNALRLPLVRPPPDRELRALQGELRLVAAQIRVAEERGRIAPRVARRQAELEAAVRSRTRLVQGDGSVRATDPRPREAARALGGRALVEYVELDGELGAVILAGGRLSFHELGPSDAVTSELEWLRFALARLARSADDESEPTSARQNADAATAALDRLLVEPLLPELGQASLVLVPTGSLHALPWSALASLRGRPLVVTPSLSTWLDLERRPRSRRRKTALVAGPRLRHAAAEVRSLASLFARPTVLEGKAATVRAALAALDGAALGHVACHGRFRSDSPLFSSLELADGPLNVYELQRLRRAPEVVVLSACDLAVSDLRPGDELLGLAAALLGMGTRTIVASVVPVPDAAARRLMLAFYRSLLDGHAPASALALAQSELAGAGFLCLGSG